MNDGGFLSNKAIVFRETLKGRPRVYEWMYILYNLCMCVFPINTFIRCKILFMADSVSKVINIVP
jgi:hypothetical protein